MNISKLGSKAIALVKSTPAQITKGYEAIKAHPKEYAIKGFGAAALGLVAYDAHGSGKACADSYQKSKDADAAYASYANTTILKKASGVQSSLKNTLFGFELDNNVRGFFNSINGYAIGFSSMLVSNVVPLALGTATVLTKGVASKVCAAGLAAYAVVAGMQDVFGIGNKKHL